MSKVKIVKKSTDTDMTPFVDIAFLILTFFIMATKMKEPDPVKAEPPDSVATKLVPIEDAVMITMDDQSNVYVSIKPGKDPAVMDRVIEELNSSRNLNLTDAEKKNFRRTLQIGVPFAQLKSFLGMTQDQQKAYKMPGIPIKDSATNEMVWWVSATKKAFAGSKMRYLIKGDSKAFYPTFESVIDALKRNEEFKYFLVTSMEEPPTGSDLYNTRKEGPVEN